MHKLKPIKKYKNSTLNLILTSTISRTEHLIMHNRADKLNGTIPVCFFLNTRKKDNSHHAEDVILNNESNKNNIYFSIYLSLLNFQVKALPSLK